MKTKTQLKNTNSKRSIAMKKSWAERRNSLGRKLARERQAKKVTQRVTAPTDLKFIGSMLEQQSQALAKIQNQASEIHSLLVNPPSNGTLAHSVEISKRLDAYQQRLGEGIAGIYRTIKQHVDAYELRLSRLEKQLAEMEAQAKRRRKVK